MKLFFPLPHLMADFAIPGDAAQVLILFPRAACVALLYIKVL